MGEGFGKFSVKIKHIGGWHLAFKRGHEGTCLIALKDVTD